MIFEYGLVDHYFMTGSQHGIKLLDFIWLYQYLTWMFDPRQGYRCLECGDAFALEQSLARHYARRSLRIEVTCNHCAKRLAFFNKCSLLLHAREHKEKGLIMQCSHLVMKPVPVEQMIVQKESAAAGWWNLFLLLNLAFFQMLFLSVVVCT